MESGRRSGSVRDRLSVRERRGGSTKNNGEEDEKGGKEGAGRGTLQGRYREGKDRVFHPNERTIG